MQKTSKSTIVPAEVENEKKEESMSEEERTRLFWKELPKMILLVILYSF